MEDKDNRRAHRRYGLALNRSIEAEICSAHETRAEPIYILDISVGGLRLNTPNPLPEAFTLQADLTGVAQTLEGRKLCLGLRRVWSRPLSGGSWVSGLELMNATASNLDTLSELISLSSGPGGRRQFRLARIQKVKLSSPSGQKWKTATCLDLSTRGLCIIIDSYLAQGHQLAVKLSPPGFSDILALAEVIWNREYFGRDMAVGLRFTDISDSAAETSQAFIDKEARL